MLDAYIIDAIRQEERERDRRADESRRIWLDIPMLPPPKARIEEEDENRGPIVIPLYRDDDDAYEDDAA